MAAWGEFPSIDAPSEFQSLFCWIGNGGGLLQDRVQDRPSVSILVLLDWEWRLALSGLPFRACLTFQSLFCWIGNGGQRHTTRHKSRMRFQSLFCWIGNGGALQWRSIAEILVRFNPCSVGLGMAAATMQGPEPMDFPVSILVLLDWEWRQILRTVADMAITRFNPCSVGLGMAARARLERFLVALCVSILVLLDWEWRQLMAHCHLSRSQTFQSLFCWIGNGGMAREFEWGDDGSVSILVLLDWEWRRHSRHSHSTLLAVSILVLLDWEWRRQLSTTIKACGVGFNPCSVGLGMAAASASKRDVNQTHEAHQPSAF